MLRRTWIAHWRRQYVEVLPLADKPQSVSPPPPPRPPRAVRSHHRWSWLDRLARTAGFGPPQLRITVAGVPAFLTVGVQWELRHIALLHLLRQPDERGENLYK
jgi:hypothetical protein